MSAPARRRPRASSSAGDPAADRERDLELGGGALDQLEQRAAALDRRGDVEEDELVGAELGVARRELDRVADLAQPLEADALDHAAAGDVEAGDHALLDHATAFRRIRAPAAPLRSGWNCTPATRAALDRGDDRAAVVDLGDGDRLAGRAAERVREVDVLAVEAVEERGRAGQRGACSSPCAARAAPCSRRTGPRRTPSPRPPSSLSSKRSCMPRQMPSTGRPAATRSRRASARSACFELARGRLGVADAGDHGERRVADDGRVGRDARLRTGAREAGRDAAQVACAVVGEDDYSCPFVEPDAPDRARLAERAAERLERRLGDVVVVLAARLDVERDPGLHREALERVREQREREAADAVAREGERRPRRAGGGRGRRRRSPAPRPSARSPSRSA